MTTECTNNCMKETSPETIKPEANGAAAKKEPSRPVLAVEFGCTFLFLTSVMMSLVKRLEPRSPLKNRWIWTALTVTSCTILLAMLFYIAYPTTYPLADFRISRLLIATFYGVHIGCMIGEWWVVPRAQREFWECEEEKLANTWDGMFKAAPGVGPTYQKYGIHIKNLEINRKAGSVMVNFGGNADFRIVQPEKWPDDLTPEEWSEVVYEAGYCEKGADVGSSLEEALDYVAKNDHKRYNNDTEEENTEEDDEGTI